MDKIVPIIQTKLRLPFTRSELVLRTRLQDKIKQGLGRPLTLITAPAGFGKTTLIASCVASCRMPVAWLSLDKDDNQIERFLSYLVAALQETNEAIGGEAEQLLAAVQPAPPEAALTSLINDLDITGSEMALVLDDYQFISNQDVHDGVVFLLEHCPTTFHLVIASRSDPPFPLTRLRGRGYIVELRAADLSFTQAEATQFLNEVVGLDLDAESVAVLAERTEGWIAGLQMASIAMQAQLSMRDGEDLMEFIEDFSGTNRYILDYLLEEVLTRQPPEIQRFLLQTSILERLTAPLCDSILIDKDPGGKGVEPLASVSTPLISISLPAERHSKSQGFLVYLERANLFLVPLDDERTWYRYHHLFADLLRVQLQKSIGDKGVARLHLRAASWHEQNGFVLEAIHHASMASDGDMVERLIKRNYLEMMNRGEMSWVRSWMGKLPRELVYQRPWLCLYEAMNLSWYGKLDEANIYLNEAEKCIQVGGSVTDAQSMVGYHAYVKSRVTAMEGDTRRAIGFCLTARENVPAESLDLQIDFSITLGYEYFLYGDFFNAKKVLNETIQLGHTARAINNPVAAYCLLARSQVYQGRLHEAHALLQKAAQLIQGADGQNLGATGLVEVGKAALLCEWNNTEAALACMKRGLDLLPWWGKADDLCLAYTTLLRIQLAQGKRDEAAETIEKATQVIQTCGIFSEAHNIVEASQVRFWLSQGDRLAANRWATSQDERDDPDDHFGFEREATHITLARVFLAQNKPHEALGLLSRLEETARSRGRMGRLIEVMILKALAMQSKGDTAQADNALTDSIALAEPEGYVRIYLDEGRQMEKLLQAYSGRTEGTLKVYADQLLEAFTTAPDRKTDISTAPYQPETLIEPLTEREAEVLKLLSAGLSNREIAERLVVSEGTIKTHTHNLYGKLGVTSRTRAIVRAKELNLI